MTINKRLTLAFSVVLAIMVVIGGMGTYSSIKSDEILSSFDQTIIPRKQAISTIDVAMSNITGNEKSLLNTELKLEDRETIYNELDGYWQELLAAKSIVDELSLTETQSQLWSEFVTSAEAWKTDHEKFIELSKSYDLVIDDSFEYFPILMEMAALTASMSTGSYDESNTQLSAIVEDGKQYATSLVMEASKSSKNRRNANTAIVIFGLIAGIGLAFFTNRTLTTSIQKIADRLRGGSEQVNSASTQLSGSAQGLAESSSEQAARLEETSSSLEEMGSQIKATSENSSVAENEVNETTKLVTNSVQEMVNMKSVINEIQDSSTETSKIIKTIDDIAFQTNLLALNAAVEAARAGEAGKGFAVVAEEVRNLAQRSAEAAKNTSDLISKSQSSAERGVEATNSVAESLDLVNEKIHNITTLITEISVASQEQATGIDQMNRAMSDMDRVVQGNASSSEEAASAAEELSSQADELLDLVESLSQLVNKDNSNSSAHSGGYHQESFSEKPVSLLDRFSFKKKESKDQFPEHEELLEY